MLENELNDAGPSGEERSGAHSPQIDTAEAAGPPPAPVAGQAAAGDAPAAKKRSGPQTLDDVLEDIDSKIDKIQTTPRAESCQKMIDALSKESSLTDDDRKVLSAKLKEMGAGS